MVSAPLVSVIVNNFKGTDKLKVCLSSIKETDYPSFEIIVSDCVTTNINNWLEVNFPEVKLRHFDKDIGPAASRNAGLSISNPNSTYIVFVDNDTRMHPCWLMNLVDLLEKTPDAGAAQPILLKMSNPDQIDSVGGFFDYIGYACVPKFPSESQLSKKNEFNICYCEAVTIIRRSVLQQFHNPTQPYDPAYFQHWEDIDLCWNIMLLGHRIILAPKSIVFHERGVSSGLGRQKANLVFLNTRNRIMTLMKHYSGLNILRYLPVLISFEIVKAVILLKNKPSHTIATIKGLTWNLTNFKVVWKKRAEIKLNVKVKDSALQKVLFRPSITRMFTDFKRHYVR